jgi:hypothetical protein
LFLLKRKTMEVFHMNTYEIYNRRKADRAFNGGNRAFKRRTFPRRSFGGQWDYIVRAVCLGCGRTLGRYENLHRLAFCYNCRKVLFPETIGPQYVPASRILTP